MSFFVYFVRVFLFKCYVKVFIGMRQKKFVQSRDDFTNYRELCEARLKRLERYKKTRSFCSLDNNEASTSSENFDLNNIQMESKQEENEEPNKNFQEFSHHTQICPR